MDPSTSKRQTEKGGDEMKREEKRDVNSTNLVCAHH